MQKNSGEFSMDQFLQFAQSPAGKQLLRLLQNTNGAAFQQAAQQASAGNYESAKDTLAPLLSSPEVRKLLEQLGGMRNG